MKALPIWAKPGHTITSQVSHEIYFLTRSGQWKGVRSERDIDAARQYVAEKCTAHNLPAFIVTRRTRTETIAVETIR